MSTPGRGSTGNVIAALCSFFAPGLGQLVQGRLVVALIHFSLAIVIWVVSFGYLGWIMHIWSAASAALFRPER
jgi:hypothetical protein